MEFINHTPFPALAFQGIDQHGQQFHVVVLRQTLTWQEDGLLVFADEQTPLCDTDEYFGEINRSSVRQESDLCHYKPKCDVIVNATAHAPQGKPVSSFNVRLLVKQPDTEVSSEQQKPVQGLDRFFVTENAQEFETNRTAKAGKVLIDKTLVVTGERAFLRRPWPFGWKLTDPEAFTELPVRAEYSFGGQCRVYAGQAESNRIQAKHRLNPQQLAAHPDASASPELCPVAHSVFEANPFGLGFIESWFLDATRLEKIPVPRIENPHTPLTPEFFQKCLTGKISQDSLAGYIASFGVRPKFHPERRRLTGTIDQAFIASEKWLPEDFDFGIWNAAQLDQQIEFLVGDEIIELTNLCTDDLPSCRKNRESDNILELKLPNYRPYALIRFQSGRLAPAILNLDTLMIEPEFIKVSLTYRLILPFDESVRIMEARQITLQQWKELLKIDAG